MGVPAKIENKPEVDPKSDKDLIRFDKNLAYRGIDFSNSFGEDGHLIFDVMVYIAYTYQFNLFKYGELDPAQFAKVMGYDRRNLLKHHSSPAQMRDSKHLQKHYLQLKQDGSYSKSLNKNNDETLLMYSVLDNAIYRAGKEKLHFTSNVRDFSGKSGYSEINFLSLLDQVTKHYKMVGKKMKIFYSFKVSPVFEIHLSRFFMMADKNVIVKLRKGNAVWLYVYLKNLRDHLASKNEYVATPNFEMLCQYSLIESKEPRERKRHLKHKLDVVFSKSDIGGHYEFVKGASGRFNYNIEIHFDKVALTLAKSNDYAVLFKAFEDRFLHELKGYYLTNIKPKHKDLKFKIWHFDNKQDLNFKLDLFVNLYGEVLKTPINKYDKVVKNYFKL